MNAEKLEQDLAALVSEPSKESFVYDLLLAYDQPKASITRLQNGDYNKAAPGSGQVLWKKKLCFQQEATQDLHDVIDELSTDAAVKKHHPRFIVVTDFTTLLSVDTKTRDTLDIPLHELPKNYDFFLPWAGLEKSQLRSEHPADIKAAERMGRLYDILLKDNPPQSDADRHALNVFLSRLLFCFFAEDTGIFQGEDQFTNAVASHTSEDASDLQAYLQRLFEVLNAEERSSYPKFLQVFPYVNGGLFSERSPVPVLRAAARKILLECGALSWRHINPDIFGSMMQAVVHTEERSNLGIHYTSVVNIMKVIEPLFLTTLREQLEKAGKSKKKLNDLLARLYQMRFFDPACGCGNFLVITYKELCRLEIEIIQRLHGTQLHISQTSMLQTSQFFGIEVDDFAHETAKLSLWLAEHQMNMVFEDVFGRTRPTLPLRDGGNIACGNAVRLDWDKICPVPKDGEVFVFGNPPYLGARNQSKAQKDDLAYVFDGHKDFKNSDYVSCWYLKAADYVRSINVSCGFVSTNSICQGEQVSCLWPRLLGQLQVGFAHQSFKWTNNAKGNAGVTCVVVGIRKPTNKPKLLYSDEASRVVKNISPYLYEGDDTIVFPAKDCLSPMPKMAMGSMARDGGHLILSTDEAAKLLEESPDVSVLIRNFVGTNDFLGSNPRKCLWIEDEHLDIALRTPEVSRRIKDVRKFRTASKAKTTNQYAKIPHKFAQRAHRSGSSIIVPKASSEQRRYIPSGFLDDSTVISDLAFAIYDAPPFLFAILSSQMHMAWLRTVAGRLKTDIRYSKTLCYNPFPFPEVSPRQVEKLEQAVWGVLDVREQYPELTLRQLYDVDSMPPDLLEAHQQVDEAVDRYYRSRPFHGDEDRIRFLFGLYQDLAPQGRAADA